MDDGNGNETTTARSLPIILRCRDCAAEVIGSEYCRSCSETRRLLPRFMCLTRGREYVRALLAEHDAADAATRRP